MDNPIFEPHFSAEHLARKISYLRNRIDELPVISLVSRRGKEYVRVKSTRDAHNYQEKRIDSKEAVNILMLAKQREQLEIQLNRAELEWARYYSKLDLLKPQEISRVIKIPECLSLSYYNNPPNVENPYPVKTSYIHENKVFRSRFEVIGAQAISELGLEFKNEIPVLTEEGYYFLDIVVPVPERGRCVGFEFCGKIDDPK